MAQAQTQLDTTRAQLIDLSVARAQYEHAIAMLTGKPPALLTVPALILKTPPPAYPGRAAIRSAGGRPDIAAAERTWPPLKSKSESRSRPFIPR